MAFLFTPQPQQQQQQQSPFQSPFNQPNPLQQTTASQPQQQPQSPFQFQLQQQPQSPFQFQLQQSQTPPQLQQPHPQQPQTQQQFYLLTNDKAPATYSTKWAELHPDSQKVLHQIEERILGYRDESQRLDQCSRLYDSSISNNGFENEASSIMQQELGGISVAIDRQKAILQKLMTVVKDMLRNTEGAVRSFMILLPRFLHQNKTAAAGASAPSQTLGAMTTQTSSGHAAANNLLPVLDFYSGVPKKPSPFLHQTVARFEKYISECRQWIEELEQLLFLDGKNSCNPSSSLLQSLPKVLANVHDYFVHVAAKVESIHQHIESMKTAYLADQRRRGDGNNPFLEADRRETAKQEAASRRIHPTLHLPAVSNPTAQATGPLNNSAAPVSSMTTSAPAAVYASSGSASSLFSTPSIATSSPSLFSTPTSSAPVLSLLGTTASPQSSPFSSLSASSSAFPISTPLFSSTPASGVSTFSTPFATGAATGSGASFGTLSARAKSRTGRR
ncbi:nuclear pore complex protein NUP58-like isoform X3 [Primulina eburnea]|uniref:nuclear pore complex protein NUP58-like isoform X3 n=1 Tax=Primulina eburnea TaxID=1245227 RepID=UPI003C6C3013